MIRTTGVAGNLKERHKKLEESELTVEYEEVFCFVKVMGNKLWDWRMSKWME